MLVKIVECWLLATTADQCGQNPEYISSQLERVERVDIVWDVYIQDSWKSTTRQKRGKGVRRRVASATAMPQNWKDFLRLDENKTELFAFLAHNITSISTEEGKDVYTTLVLMKKRTLAYSYM